MNFFAGGSSKFGTELELSKTAPRVGQCQKQNAIIFFSDMHFWGLSL